MEINFYQIDQIDQTAIANLAHKILKLKKRLLIFGKDQELLKQIDDKMWSFSKTKFLPHATKWEIAENKNCKLIDQPIFITNEELEDDFQQLIKFSPVTIEFAQKFEKIFYFFYSQNIEIVKEFYTKITTTNNCKINIYRKNQNKWISDTKL